MTDNDSAWARRALAEIATISERQRSLAFPLGATLGTRCPVWFVDERRKFAGSHKVHMVAARLAAGIASGAVGRATRLVLDSCGTTALTLALMANAIGARCRIYCPMSTAKAKLRYLRQLGAEVTLVPCLDSAREAAAAVCAREGAFHVDQFDTRTGEGEATGCYGAAFLAAVRRAVGTAPSDILSCIGSGGALMALHRAARAKGNGARVHVVDLPDGQFARAGRTAKPGPGHSIDGLNQEFRPACVSADALARIVPVPEADAFGACIAMREGCGELIGLTSGFVLAGALRLRDEICRGNGSGLACVPIYDTGNRYPHKLRNREFLEALGEEYDEARARYGDIMGRPRAEQAA